MIHDRRCVASRMGLDEPLGPKGVVDVVDTPGGKTRRTIRTRLGGRW